MITAQDKAKAIAEADYSYIKAELTTLDEVAMRWKAATEKLLDADKSINA